MSNFDIISVADRRRLKKISEDVDYRKIYKSSKNTYHQRLSKVAKFCILSGAGYSHIADTSVFFSHITQTHIYLEQQNDLLAQFINF